MDGPTVVSGIIVQVRQAEFGPWILCLQIGFCSNTSDFHENFPTDPQWDWDLAIHLQRV